jgi:hypothetical protein
VGLAEQIVEPLVQADTERRRGRSFSAPLPGVTMSAGLHQRMCRLAPRRETALPQGFRDLVAARAFSVRAPV